MFPIRDRRGRTISFGGRVLGDGQPKYLNGPETDLFSKRRTLYGLDVAREAARGGAEVVVAEGYMDVIALHQAGFGAAVAPLGTALTEDQLEELWRLSPMPVLCFDGDAAGARAAGRAAETALPLLTAERSLRLATLPAKEDPDSLVRRGGAPAFQAVLDAARPLADALFDLLRESGGDGTPEQRAALRARLEAAAGKIGDKALAWRWRSGARCWTGSSRRPRRQRPRRRAPPSRRRGSIAPDRRRPEPPPNAGRNLLAILLHHPNLLHDVEEAFGAFDLPPPLARLRNAILQLGGSRRNA